jgi:hypothetical protein
MKESRARIDYTAGTGKPPRIIVIEVDPDHPVAPEPIVSRADEPGPIVILRDRPRKPVTPGPDDKSSKE